jgi:pyruvate/2-oxoglutarate dehydrogenase complex dihydrolipoamide dehydrogenase (E3) component
MTSLQSNIEECSQKEQTAFRFPSTSDDEGLMMQFRRSRENENVRRYKRSFSHISIVKPVKGSPSHTQSKAMRKEDKGARVAIIGAGPVGCVAAIHFAQRGWKVDIFEQRPGNDSPSV